MVSEFKVGDRVRGKKDTSYNNQGFIAGKEFTVTEVKGRYVVGDGGDGADGGIWFQNIELVNDVKPKYGDTVRIHFKPVAPTPVDVQVAYNTSEYFKVNGTGGNWGPNVKYDLANGFYGNDKIDYYEIVEPAESEEDQIRREKKAKLQKQVADLQSEIDTL